MFINSLYSYLVYSHYVQIINHLWNFIKEAYQTAIDCARENSHLEIVDILKDRLKLTKQFQCLVA